MFITNGLYRNKEIKTKIANMQMEVEIWTQLCTLGDISMGIVRPRY